MSGLLGIVAVVASLFMSFPDIPSALASVGAAAALTVIGAIFILRRVPESKLWSKLSLETRLEHPGFEQDDPDDPVIKVGARGQTLSPLRPSGTIQVGEFRLDAVSDGAFIPAGATIEIVRIIGNRVTVRHVSSDE